MVRTRQRRWLPEGFFGPVEYAARTAYRRPPGFYRRLQSIAPVFRKLGMTPNYVVELEVAGRRSGIPHRTLLVQVDHQGGRYLVSLAGESEWVRNVRSAAGHVRLRPGPGDGAARLVELPVDQRAEVIRAYVRRPSPRGRAMVRIGEARHYFGIEPDSSIEQIAAIAGNYPVFRVERAAPPDSSAQARTRGAADARSPILRASPTDRAMLAMGWGAVPEQIGVLLVLDAAEGLDRARLTALLDERVRAVPPLRRRLMRVAPGCGGPIWIDDPAFDIRRHVREVRVPEGTDLGHLRDLALDEVATPVPWTAPPWSALLVTGLGGGRAGLVVVIHHVLADGLGGLALLGALADPGLPPAATAQAPVPTRRALAASAWSQRWDSARHAGRGWTALARSLSATGGLHARRAGRTSLLRSTGSRRRIAVVSIERARLVEPAHGHGATVNDVILVAIAAALARVLAVRGESVDPLVMVVPVSGRRAADDSGGGNLVAPLLVPVPTSGPITDRLASVSAYIRAQRDLATGPPPIAVAGWLFRPLAALGVYRWYLNHQRRFHTLVTTVRGPERVLRFAGCPVTSATPISLGDNGNVTIHCSVLSYAGRLTIAAIVDPDRFPELDLLADALTDELNRMATLGPPAIDERGTP